jgi:exopolyphosphatase/pppGpp-phosphohydrolase
MPGMNPQRADILLAGALILECAFSLTLHEQALVSTLDLLLGTLLQAAA